MFEQVNTAQVINYIASGDRQGQVTVLWQKNIGSDGTVIVTWDKVGYYNQYIHLV